jgi:hypothetical protein
MAMVAVSTMGFVLSDGEQRRVHWVRAMRRVLLRIGSMIRYEQPGLAQLLERINLTSYTALLRITPLITLGVSILLTAAIALIFRGRPRRRAIWGSSPFMAVGIIILYSLILLTLLNIPGQIAIMSESFALQISGLMRILYLRMALISGTCLVGGAAWMHLAYRSSRLKKKQEVSQ